MSEEKVPARFIVDIYRVIPNEDGVLWRDETHLKDTIVKGWDFNNPKDVQVKQANTWNDVDTLPKEHERTLIVYCNSWGATPVGSQGYFYSMIYWSNVIGQYTSAETDERIAHESYILAWAYAPEPPYKYRDAT